MKEINKLLNGCKVAVFLDFEGTQFTQEIIAIGAVKCELDNKNQIKKVFPGFKYFVKAHGEVGSFVTKLTGINDAQLDKNGINFLFTMKYFQKYVGKHKNIKFITYGNFDMRLLHQTAKAANLENDPFIKSIFKNYIDFSSLFGKYCRSKKGTQLSLADGLKLYEINPEGDAHDPLYDAINLMYLYKEFIKKKAFLIEQYRQVLLKNKVYPAPIARIIKDLRTKGTTSIEELNKYIEEDLW